MYYMERKSCLLICILLLASCEPKEGREAGRADTLVRIKASGAIPPGLPEGAVDTPDPQESIKTLRSIFEAYTAHEEGIDSEDNKNAVTQNLLSLDTVRKPEDLQLLINMWHYYDPTDYSCRQMILDILLRDKAAAIAAVEYRMKHKKSWETGATEFGYLLDALQS